MAARRRPALEKHPSMRGPGLKVTLDVRRTWRCPACGYERRADGRYTSLRCRCAAAPFMQLVAEPHFRRAENRPVDPYVDAEELLGALDSAEASNAVTASGGLQVANDEPRSLIPFDHEGGAAAVTAEETPASERQLPQDAPESAEEGDAAPASATTSVAAPNPSAEAKPPVESSGRPKSRRRRRGRGRPGPGDRN